MDTNKELRFKLGDEVLANVGKWMRGKVVKLWYRAKGWPDERPSAPYQIKLESGGQLVFAPQDNDKFVKSAKPKVPVTVLTGFLGSGKTTLLNHILKENHGLKIGIIENEFGAISIDDKLLKEGVQRTDGVVVEMKNGCVCCTVRSDLASALKEMFKDDRKLDAVIIETTGMADPAPVIQMFCIDEYASTNLNLDACITLVDTKHIIQHLDNKPAEGADNEAISQVAFGDRILMNKLDLVDEKERLVVEKRIRSINSTAQIIPCTLKEKMPDLKNLLGINAFNLENVLKEVPNFLKDDSDDDCSGCSDDEHNHDHEHGHEHEHGHGHGHAHEGKAEDKKEESDKKKHKHKHKHKKKHDPLVNSFVLRYKGDVDIAKLNRWIQNILQTHSKDIYRMKGILAIKGSPRKFVFQGVHMIFDASPSEAWKPDEERESILVFIGRKMRSHEEQFRKDFEAILAKD